MKTVFTILLSAVLFTESSSAQEPGLFLRAVVEEGSEDAQELTDEDGRKVFVSSAAIILPDDVEAAKIEGSDEIFISFEFKPSAHPKLYEATKSMIGKRLAVIIDGELISTPVVVDPFSSGASVKGNFTREWAESVVERTNADPKG